VNVFGSKGFKKALGAKRKVMAIIKNEISQRVEKILLEIVDSATMIENKKHV
jgi:hypothetical protein